MRAHVGLVFIVLLLSGCGSPAPGSGAASHTPSPQPVPKSTADAGKVAPPAAAAAPPAAPRDITVEGNAAGKVEALLLKHPLWKGYVDFCAQQPGAQKPLARMSASLERTLGNNAGTGGYRGGSVQLMLTVSDGSGQQTFFTLSDTANLPSVIVARGDPQEAAFNQTEKQLLTEMLDCAALAALATLGQAGTPTLTPLALEKLKDKNDTVKAAAAEALAVCAPLGKETVAQLAGMACTGGHAVVRSASLATLVKLGAPALEAFRQLRLEAAWNVRQNIAECLAEFGQAGVPALIEGFTDAKGPERDAFCKALGKVGAEAAEACPALIEALKKRDSLARDQITDALGQIGLPALPGLIAALKSEDPVHWAGAALALGKLGPEAKAAVPDLIRIVELSKLPGDAASAEQALVSSIDALGRIGAAAGSALPSLEKGPKRGAFVRGRTQAAINKIKEQLQLEALNTSATRQPRALGFQEQMLGEVPTNALSSLVFSPQTGLWAYEAQASARRKLVVFANRKSESYDKLGDVLSKGPNITLSPDGLQLAYTAEQGGRSFVVMATLQGDRPSTAYAQVGRAVYPFGARDVAFTPDSKRIAFRARKEKAGKCFMLNGDQPGEEFSFLGDPFFSADGRLAYWANLGGSIMRYGSGVQDIGGGWQLYTPGGHLSAVVGGKWYMVVDGKRGPEFGRVDPPVFSADGKALAYRAVVYGGTGGKWGQSLIVLNDKSGPEFEQVGQPVFSAAGTLAYAAAKGLKQEYAGGHREFNEWFVMLGEQKGPSFDEVGQPVFSAQGKLAYKARTGMKWFLVVDGQKSADEFSALDQIVFSPDGAQVAFGASPKQSQHIVVCGTQRSEVYRANPEALSFSPDGQLAYRVGNLIVWGSQRYSEFDRCWPPLVFSADGSQAAFLACKGNTLLWKVLNRASSSNSKPK